MARPRKSRPTEPGEPAASPLGPPIAFDPAAVDALLGGRQTMAELDDLFRQMKKHLMERALSGELTHHLGYASSEAKRPSRRTCAVGRRRKRCSPRMARSP